LPIARLTSAFVLSPTGIQIAPPSAEELCRGCPMPDFLLRMRCFPVLLLAFCGSAFAEPMDLRDPTPRWVEVEFESSPPHRPGQLDAVWTGKVAAWLQPAGRSGWVLVAVPREAVESHLVVTQDPKPRAFQEFVWLFDAETGHVLSADLDGVVHRRLDWGFFRTRVETEIHVEMSTEHAVGFRRPREVLGQRVHDACGSDDPQCTPVSPVPYDPATGYVNAVGHIIARANGITTHTFSSLGEARFSEREGATPTAVSAGN
jgi:hypothetical protein